MLFLLIALAGCQSQPMRDVRHAINHVIGREGGPTLARGLREYDNGNYAQSARSLRLALDQGLSRADQVKAHKYLAFISCADGRMAQCRDEFRAALNIDPSMRLEPAEAGHPIWGPVFRSVKAAH